MQEDRVRTTDFTTKIGHQKTDESQPDFVSLTGKGVDVSKLGPGIRTDNALN